MAYVGNSENIMKPRKGSDTVTIPITMDYRGGRQESNKSRKLWTIIVSVLGLIIGFGIIFGKNGNFFINLILGVGFMFIVSLVIRFVFLKEKSVRESYEMLEVNDYQKSFREEWGIYSIEEEYPYFVRYRSGRSGLFVRLNKDVILGKYSENEYEHYEAIGDAYNLAGSKSISMCHIDYMDNVGSDERLEESFVSLVNVSNTDLKDLLTDMFTHLQTQMEERVTTFDVYAFTFKCSDSVAWNQIQRILSCFLEANYVNYHVLDSNDLRNLFKTLKNVHEFSVNNAMTEAVTAESSRDIVPIRVIYEDGSEEKLNKTIEEKETERELAEKEKRAKEQEVKRRKNKKKYKVEEEEEQIDLFEQEG